MKKIQTLILLTAMLFSTQTIASAIQTRNVSEQQAINKKTQEQIQSSIEKSSYLGFESKIYKLADRYVNNLRTCEPLHYHDYIDIFGLKINLQFDINGWKDNKCSYFMTGNVDSIGKDIREVFEVKVADEKIAKIAPQIQCNFTKDELNILVDGILSKTESDIVESVLKPTDKYQEPKPRKLTPEEKKMIKMLSNGKTCTIPNMDELIQQFSELNSQETL